MTAEIESRLRTCMRPLSAYLALRGADRGEQRIATSGLALAAIGVLVWGLRQYLGSYL